MSKQILVNASHYETRVATLEDGEIRQLHIEREEDKNVVGNIYLGVVKRVLPGMQAAFLELGLERTAFLYVDDIIDEPFGNDIEYLDEVEEGAASLNVDENDEDETSLDIPEETLEAKAEKKEPVVVEEVLPPKIKAPIKSKSEPIITVPTPPQTENLSVKTTEELDLSEAVDFDPDDKNLDDLNDDEDLDDFDDEGGDEDGDEGESEGQEDQDDLQSIEDKNSNPTEKPLPVEEKLLESQPQATSEERPEVRPDVRPDARNEGGREQRRPYQQPRTGTGQRPQYRADRRPQPRTGGGYNREGGGGGGTGNYNREGGGGGGTGNYNREGGGGGGTGNYNREGGAPRRDFRGRDSGRRPPQRGGFRRGPGGGGGQNRGRFQKRRQRGSANIQDLLKEGQEILVQVAKAPIGTKGARLTTHISLPGRNLVLMPTVKHLGISRRIGSDRERRRLRDIFTKKIRPRGVGFIIRTVAENKSFKELKADAEYLMMTWDKIKKESQIKRAPALIHEDLSLSMRSVRDFFTEEVDSFVIDNAEEYETILGFIGQFTPRLKSRVKLFKGPSQLFEHYGIEAEISRALGKKVWLKSGGYLLIDQSEALTAIDVNTGRYVGTKSLEETILKTNLEAVKEIAYQLRIRNVGGIIIIDLIDMESHDNREVVYQALQEALSEDKSKTNILKISELGLVEMTRKRTHEDLVRYLTEACSYCEGRGYHKSSRTVCFEIFREVEKEALSTTKNIVVFAAPSVVQRMTNEEKKHVDFLEKRFDKKIIIKQDLSFHFEQFEVFGKH